MLLSANTGENVTKAIIQDPMKKALVQIQGIFAELDKSLLVQRLHKARDKKRKETGRCEGPKPFYDNSDILKELRRLIRKRKSGIRLTFRQIAEKLNEKGLVTAKGRPYNSGNLRVILLRTKKQ